MPLMSPIDVFDGSFWKLTLPIGPPEKPTELFPAALANYTSEYFYYNFVTDGATFKCPTNGVSTSGSSYSRCELRELTKDGKLAAWPTKSGIHVMTLDLSVDALPKGKKKELVFCQIHGGKDDLTTGRFVRSDINTSMGAVWITDGDNSRGYFVANVLIGQRFQFAFIVKDGVINYKFNDEPVPFSLNRDSKTNYFKLGCYPQAKDPVFDENGKPDFGQVTVYSAMVGHDFNIVIPPPPDEVAKLRVEVDELRKALGAQIERTEDRFARLKAAL